MSKVTKPIGKMAYTRGLILMFLQTRGRPARTSEIRKAVLQCYAEAAVYGCLGELQAAGELTCERDALFALRRSATVAP
jgi:hypothetical protein